MYTIYFTLVNNPSEHHQHCIHSSTLLHFKLFSKAQNYYTNSHRIQPIMNVWRTPSLWLLLLENLTNKSSNTVLYTYSSHPLIQDLKNFTSWTHNKHNICFLHRRLKILNHLIIKLFTTYPATQHTSETLHWLPTPNLFINNYNGTPKYQENTTASPHSTHAYLAMQYQRIQQTRLLHL